MSVHHTIADHLDRLNHNFKFKTEEWYAEYHFIRGLIEMAHKAEVQTYEDCVDAWKRLSWMVASDDAIEAYFALRGKIESMPEVLQAYQLDFYQIDFEQVWKNPNRPFIIILREKGTELVWLDQANAIQSLEDRMKSLGDTRYVGVWTPRHGLVDLLLFCNWKTIINDYQNEIVVAAEDTDNA